MNRKKRIRSTFVCLILALVLMLSACADPSKGPATPTEAPEDEISLSNFTAEDLDGNPVDEGIFEGYTLSMINIWATYCGPCINEMPELGELGAQYADEGVQIVGIVADALNSDGTYSEARMDYAREIIDYTGADYVHLVPTYELAYAALRGIEAVPTTLFVDSGGNRVGDAYVGARSKEDWATIVDALLLEAGKGA